jgi:hypothetical protein
MNGRWILAIVISALLGAGLFAAGLLVGLSFSPRVQRVTVSPAVRPGRMQGPVGPRIERPRAGREPLTLEEAGQSAEEFLQRAHLEDLDLGRILVFESGAYVVVEKAGSEEGAFELQVDPVTRRASVEFGPTMMWNTEFGLTSGQFPGPVLEMHPGLGRFDRVRGIPGAHGRRAGNTLRFFHRALGAAGLPAEAEGGVTQDEALAIAERYLAAHARNLTLAREAQAFPGYYTIDILKDGVVHGLISVNAETGQVWPHVWRGEVVEASE